MQLNLFNKAVVWSKTNCQYCDMVKDLLNANNYEIEIRSIEQDYDEFRSILPIARTVPQVFIDGKYIGGYKEVRAFLDDSIK